MNRNVLFSFLSWCNEINEEDVTGCMDEGKIEKKATRQLAEGTSSRWEGSTVSNLRSSIARSMPKEEKKKKNLNNISVKTEGKE